ncbi:hypothetical protein NW756_005634 [Fusarium oxysporum]|nr:hypothetical protein NW763_013520 [Fusarium oxysporum]WKT48156.1 hypothetical protein QSH57_013061 [Fusarium oxysporum f. sp. vasinfectum]KAJ4041349.1 hypothetical protein NW753_010759 [Fusarium oxysporum]KAJ4091434.1 hypothetical protein NW756_005634 [Fusarium oxysporum]KAJ4092632.1 hypothetical protein NW769_012626 [Fusarium oxysporum]
MSPNSPSGPSNRGQSRRDPYGSLITPETSDETEPLVVVRSARFRTASPELRRLPLVQSMTRHIPPVFGSDVQRKIHEEVHSVLQARKLETPDTIVDIQMREQPDAPETARPTILVITPWIFGKEEEAHRIKAVEQIVKVSTKLIREAGDNDTQLHVEIIAPELSTCIYFSPVRDEPQLFKQWDHIRPLVNRRLDAHSSTRGRMTLIALLRYGLKFNTSKNPITIYISVNYDSEEEHWQSVIDDIQSNLSKFGYPALPVHIEHNVGVHSADFELLLPMGDRKKLRSKISGGNLRIEGDYKAKIDLGDPIGAARYVEKGKDKGNPLFGTFGCYIEIKKKGSSRWEKYGLTNYHVVRPAINGFELEVSKKGVTQIASPQVRSNLHRVDNVGFKPSSMIPAVAFECPPRIKHNYTIWAINDEISQREKVEACTSPYETAQEQKATSDLLETEKKHFIEEKAAKIAHFNKGLHTIGKLYAASGFKERSDDQGRLDWALININNSRVGNNQLPGKETWKRWGGDAPFLTYNKPLRPQAMSIRLNPPTGMQRTTDGWKLGATTGATAGEFHSIKFQVNLLDDRHLNVPTSTEYAFQSRNLDLGRFSCRGDSGSVVYDERGGIVGLMFRGQVLNGASEQSGGLIYVTPIEHVFNSIKGAHRKDDIEDIRIAEN